MTLQLSAVGINANHPRDLASFWAFALHREVVETDGLTWVRGPESDGVAVVFTVPGLAKVGQNRHHLDLTTTSLEDQRRTVADLIARGARPRDVGQSAQETHVVLADPEGNEFCVLGPDNQFLADCERLGAINCDGRRHTGEFWSQVLGWPLVWDQDEETAIRAAHTMITWSGPPLMAKPGVNRLQLLLRPAPSTELPGEVERLLSLGARPSPKARGDDHIELLDPDGNEFRIYTER